jgi:hypothetical protein
LSLLYKPFGVIPYFTEIWKKALLKAIVCEYCFFSVQNQSFEVLYIHRHPCLPPHPQEAKETHPFTYVHTHIWYTILANRAKGKKLYKDLNSMLKCWLKFILQLI